MTTYETIDYAVQDATAVITLDRPEDLNTIVPPMLDELEDAVTQSIRDRAVKVILLQGAGRSFCAGFNFAGGFTHWNEDIATEGEWDAGRDLIMATSQSIGWVPRFMSLWRSPKPVIAQVHGWCVGGGSEMALCADIVIASQDARIGTPYSRMWGCHHAGMWVYRLGLAKAKELALTGRSLSGDEAAELGLINRAVPFEELEAATRQLAGELATIPLSQLASMKLVVNQAYDNMGLASTQLLGSVMDSMMRNTPEARAWIELAESEGVGAAVAQRDGPFGDYSQGDRELKPDPTNVVRAGRAR
ncbi:crotonase/enoyl-CoA hydratase family protein [Capillimicrobium parvum]|uniref:1,4-dihydroxy-2-naphthoyl-CoA synthase n=1 Tax=Capillimicrobium parvum TaxID=2884022 RepID=A0A9E7C0C7_9ACTN|nr:crotonase/enoyl-CoA hydratase family protein [Capillimicrobium parvum]UGS35489.1 1,4-dihydroxy-2-naphthoyl-CoA synthase [Capillimicrobium parvum]